MNHATQTNTAALIITYFPDVLVTARIRALLTQFPKVFVVDNSATPTSTSLLELLQDDRVHIRYNTSNLGLATALNQGVQDALDQGFEWGVTFDQDTLAYPNMLGILIDIQNHIGHEQLILGSNYHDLCRGKPRTDCRTLWQSRKTVISSGMLFPLRIAQNIGGFRDEYFIDSVDHEFCLRARTHGLQIAMSCEPLMAHTIGNALTCSIGWLRKFMPYNHPPQRKYYMMRNTLRTVGMYWRQEPLWCLRQLARLNVELAAAMFEEQSREKLAACVAGMAHALQGRMGPLDDMTRTVRRPSKRPELVIMGVHQATEGYPNTLYRLNGLHDLSIYQITEICAPMKQPQWATKRRGTRLVSVATSAIWAHLKVLFRYAGLPHRQAIFYVPYPAIFLLAILSCLPRRFRPKNIIADAFISIHETLVDDRKALGEESLLARAIFALEKRAYHCADIIVCDTPQNAAFLQAAFGLPAEKLIAIPLSTNEVAYRPAPYVATNKGCRILFIGTMIPLHGVDVILQAAAMLSAQQNLHFRLIGNGQMSPEIELAIRDSLNIEWERAWQSPDQLAEEIRNADICLGIFGASDKAQRVCPLKIYAYAAVGRAIITGETAWLTQATTGLSKEPFAAVRINDAAALATKIVQLANAPTLRADLAANSRQFYENHLSNQVALQQLVQVLDRLGPMA